MAVLVTGGLGFIGSHTCVELLENGYEVVVIDNLYNSKISVIDSIKDITGKDIKFYKANVCDEQELDLIFNENVIDSVIHFAGFKAVGESVVRPLDYYTNNILSTLNLCRMMLKHNVNKLVFSSTSTIYGETNIPPFTEDMPYGEATNPYTETKIIIEHILKDVHNANKNFSVALLRYFNPVGAHESGLIGEDPIGIPNNLFPYISRVAIGKLEKLTVFGNDYDTPDGTGIRDYIHVMDLARAHVLAIKHLDNMPDVYVYNIGTGKGSTVLEVVKSFEKACGMSIPYVIGERRPGDVAALFADTSKAKNELGFETKYDLDKMCEDGWNFITKHMDSRDGI